MKTQYKEWSPAQLAYVLNQRIDLRGGSNGVRSAWFVDNRTGRARCYSHGRACGVLSRVAARIGIDPACPPLYTPRALQNGRKVAP